MDFETLYSAALEVLKPRRISEDIEVGGVAAALVTDKGNIFRGVCIDTACSMGFCAEHAAVSAMVTAGESRVEAIVAVGWDKKVMSPCGRCRELLMQLGNPETRVFLSPGTAVTVREILPYYWAE